MAMTGGTAKLVHTGYGGGASNFPIKVYVYYKHSQSVANNQSTITCGMYVVTNSGWDIGAWSDYGGSYVGTTSNTFDGTIPNFSGTRWLVENKTFTVNHNDDGTGSATIRWKWGVRSSWGQCYEPSGSFSITLPTIARASVPTVSASSVTMKNELTITTNRMSSSFTHTLKYTFGGSTGTIATGVGAFCKWPVPDLAAKCSNATSGTATITCITYSGNTQIGTKTCTVTLNVPAQSTPTFSASSVTMGNSVMVYTNRGSSNFTHTLEFWFAGTKITTAYSVTESKSFDVSLDLAKKIPSDPSGTVTIWCNTYNGTKKVGTSIARTFTATVPDNSTTKPSASFALTPAGTLPSAFSGLYIQGKTGVKADFTASSTYSTVSSYKMSVDGKSYTGDPATSNLLTQVGSVTVTGAVTDARGYSNTSLSKKITVYKYRSPEITNIVCERSLQDKTYDDAGTYLHIKARRVYEPVEVSGVQKNFCTLKYQYKVEGGSWSKEKTLIEGTDLSTDVYEGAIPDVVSRVDKSYSVRLIVTDTMGVPSIYNFSIPTAEVILHLAENGYGVAIGKYAEIDNALEIAEDWDVYGRVYSLGKLKAVPEGADFNSAAYRVFGAFGVGNNALAATISNIPTPSAGRLIVSSANGTGKTSGSWTYILQEYISLNGDRYYRLCFTMENEDEWNCNDWTAG